MSIIRLKNPKLISSANILSSMARGYRYDNDAERYISAVETADGQVLELDVRLAISQFIIGCKNDGIWNSIKASCILMGARTLTGALTPLAGVAPTNFNFVSGDYNRKTGLLGNGTTKYLDTNRPNNSDPQNSNHNAVFLSEIGGYDNTSRAYIGSIGINPTIGVNAIVHNSTAGVFTRSRNNDGASLPSVIAPQFGIVGHSRASSTSYTVRVGRSDYTLTSTSQAPDTSDIFVFRRADATTPSYSNGRIAFYSVGESLSLSSLENRVSTLYYQLALYIP